MKSPGYTAKSTESGRIRKTSGMNTQLGVPYSVEE